MNLNAGTPTAQSTDEQLLELYRQGQSSAFEILVDRYRIELFHFLVRFVNDPAAAEDLFQETFLQIHLSIQSFDTDRSFRPWLFTIAANKARDFLRRNRDRSIVPLSAQVGEGGDGRPLADLLDDGLPTPSELVASMEMREAVRKVVDTMPSHLKEILLLAYFHQFPYKEIAEMLAIPLGTVKSRLHSAVATFVELWKRQYQQQA